MPSSLEFIRGLSFDFENITGTTSVNADINTFNTSTGLDYLTIENVNYTLGGVTRFDFTISKTRLLTVYINGKSASVQLTKPINIIGKYNIKLHQRKYTSGESFTNVKMWRKCVSSNRLSIEHLNYEKEYKVLAPYIRPIKPITLLYKSGTGLNNLVGSNLVLRSFSLYFAIPYDENATNADSREDGATCDIVVPINAYSMGIYLTCSDSVAFGHLMSFGDPNQSLTIGQSAFTIIFDILITSQFSLDSLKVDIGGVSNFFKLIAKGLASLGALAKVINDSIKKQFSNPPVVASDNGTKIGWSKPSGGADVKILGWSKPSGGADVKILGWSKPSGGADVKILGWSKPSGGADVKIYPDGAKDIGITFPIFIIEPNTMYYSQLPPTFVNETINRSMTITRQTSAGLSNTINFRYNSYTALPICIIFYSAGLPRAWLGTNALSSEIVDVVTSFVEYRFNNTLNDISGRSITLIRSGTGTSDTLYSDSSLGTGYGYIKVLNPYTVYGNIATTNTFISIASKLANATGMRLLFKIKLNNTTAKDTPIFTIGKLPKVTDLGVNTMSSGAGNLSRGMMLRINNSKLSYMFIDANGNYTQLNASASYSGNDGLLSTSAWTSIEIVKNRLVGTDNKILFDLYFNNVESITTLTNTSTGFGMSYSGGVNNNLLRFTGYSEAHNIADFKIFLSDNRTARSTINPLNFGGSMPLVSNTSKLYLGVINNSITNAISKTWISYPDKILSITVVTSTEDLDREDMLL